MSYSWGGGFGGNAVVGVGNNKNQGNNGVGWGVGGVPPGADNSNKAAPPGQVGKSDAATEISNRAATASTAAAAAATSSGDSSWGGFRGGSWGPSNTAGSGDGFSTGRLGGSGLGGSGRGGDAAAGRGGTLGGSSSFGRGGSTDGTTSGFSTGRGGEGRGRGSGDGSRTSSAGGGDRGSRGFSGGGDNGGFSTGRGGGDRGGRGGSGDGGAGAAAVGGGRGSNSGEGRGSSRGEGGGRGEGGQTGRGRRMMSVKDDVVITNGNGVLAAGFENWGVAGWGRQLMQIAGVSAGAVATVSGPQGSLGDLTSQSNFHPELPPGSDYRSAWADQANSQALGQASMGRKRLVLLGGIDYWGLLLLGVSLLLVLMYLLIKLLVVKRRATNRLRMDPCYSGAFRLAAARGDVRTMQAIADGCPGRFHVNADHEGFTALHAAAVEGKVAALLWLCQQGADVSLMKDDGWRDTALHYAAAKGHTHCCQVLLAYGADLHAKNYAGQTPADVAARSGYKKLSNFLNRYATGQTPKSSIKTLPVTLKQQLSAALQQYSDALRMQVLIPANAPAAKATTKTMQTAACKEGVNILAQAVAAMGPLNTVGTRSRSITAASLTDQAAAAVNKVQGQQKGCVAADAVAAAAVAAARSLAKAAGQRGWDGVGTQGTQLAAGVRIFRVIATITQLTAAGYIVWRALRTLNPGWSYLLSVPIWLCEFAGFMMSNAFIVSLWNQIIRPPRKISEMLDDGDVPAVDVYVPTYSEPVSVLEPTVIAALNMTWPGSKLCVYVLDDGARPEVAQMVQSVKFQLLYMGREAELVYVARQKVKGVDHHAKAGNINSALLKEAPGKGTFLLVLDCDMIIHPNFLQNILGHFYKPADTIAAVTAHNQKHSGVTVSKKSADDGVTTDLKTSWVLKDKAGFIQTPQDFWNVDATDPLVHSARFFYGPMLQGRDGIGACPCCGTGVVFRRDALIAMGGQSYGSITEDYNTAMNMLGAGFSTMFLNERLVFGMAPDDLPTALQQRLRWAMGALQILSRTNPLTVPGLTFTQSLLFFEALAHHWLAIATVLLAILPIPFLFTGYSPVVAPAMWEFTLAFGVFYTFNRIMLWWVHRHVEGGSQEMWRGSQMWVWISPNHIRAIWKVLVAENWLMKRIFNFEITFAVTKKDKDGDGSSRWDSLYSTMGVTWPYIIWLLGFLAGLCYFIVKACMGLYSAWEVVVYLISIMWGTLVLLSIWPPLSSLLPREETEEGWKICWDAVLPLPASRAQRATQRAALQDKSMHPGQVLRQQKAALQPISLDSLDSTTPAASTSAAAAAQDDYVVPDFDDALLKHHQPETQSLRHQHSTGSSVDNDPALPADIVVSHVARDQQIDRNQRGAGLGWHSFEVSSNIVHSQEKLERSGSGLLHRKSRRRSHADQSYAEPAHTVLPFTGVDVIDYQLHRRAPGALRGSAADAAPRRMSHDMRQGSSRMSGIWMLPHITEDTGVGSHDKSNKGHALEVSAIDDDILPDMSPLSAAGILHGPQRGTVSSFSGAVGPTDTAAAVNPKAAAPNNGLLASMSTTLRRRMSFLDPHPRHHTADHLAFLTTTDIVPFSASAAAARAVGPAAFGRIGLPGRTRHMMEASSLYTHVILPEPGISVGGSRVADSQRLLAVGTDGMLMPLSTASGATLSHHTLPGHQEETEESHGLGSLQQPGVRSAAEDLKVRHDSGSSSSKSSSPTAVEDGEATVMEVVAAAGAGVAGLVNSEVQHQLQQLATAVTLITEQIENAPATTNELAECDTVKVNNSSNNTAAAAGIVPVFGNNGRQYSLTLHRAGSTKPTMEIANWAALGSIFGANRILQSLNYTQMFNSHCAVIPTLPENIYDHTIAAVPNFNERQTPKASWMFVLVNFSLLVVLFAASLVEVYVG